MGVMVKVASSDCSWNVESIPRSRSRDKSKSKARKRSRSREQACFRFWLLVLLLNTPRTPGEQ
eukprot:1311497-Amphidinium_carterae.1